ncbi:MAG: glycosyltransferase family 2 protein [Lysobacterales bacterium]
MLDEITPLVITYNEEANLERTLAALRWAKRVVVLDSGSQDRTREIASTYANVEWHERAFDHHAGQCNHALTRLLTDASFVLSLDADYVVTAALREEMAALRPDDAVSGYRIPFRYCIDGVALRGTLYPPRVCLYRPQRARYRQQGHAHFLEVSGAVLPLKGPMLHDDRKPNPNFVARQHRYAAMEARYLLSRPWRELNWKKRVRRLLVIAPWLVPAYVLFAQGVILDGRPGLRYAWERLLAECLIAYELARQTWTGAHA